MNRSLITLCLLLCAGCNDDAGRLASLERQVSELREQQERDRQFKVAVNAAIKALAEADASHNRSILLLIQSQIERGRP